MPDEGTVDHDFSHDAWLEVDGNHMYVQRTILYSPDSISFPEKYRRNLPCVIQIRATIKRGENKGELMYPDLYVLRDHMLLTKELKKGKKGIQKGKVDGRIIPIQELEAYKPGHKLV
jgi:hypothetical protein